MGKIPLPIVENVNKYFVKIVEVYKKKRRSFTKILLNITDFFSSFVENFSRNYKRRVFDKFLELSFQRLKTICDLSLREKAQTSKHFYLTSIVPSERLIS